MEYIQSFVIAYGYPTIFFLLYFGLLGLPCAEESFLLFVGITLTNRTLQTALPLNLPLSVLIAIMGSSAGMVTAFLIGYYIGKPFLMKYGRFVGLTGKHFSAAENLFRHHAPLALIAGYFIPGVRQINPYLAGLSHTPFSQFLPASFLGASFWATSIILAGYFLGRKMEHYLDSGWVILPLAIILLPAAILLLRRLSFKKKNAS
ncbi:MAG: DedA family protein [Sporolactobacillus sp.]